MKITSGIYYFRGTKVNVEFWVCDGSKSVELRIRDKTTDKALIKTDISPQRDLHQLAGLIHGLVDLYNFGVLLANRDAAEIPPLEPLNEIKLVEPQSKAS